MACSCGGGHSNSFVCMIRTVTNNALMSVQNVVPSASQTVELVYITRIQPRPYAGDPGGEVINKIKITPAPLIETNIKMYQPDGSIVEKTGSAKLKNIIIADKEGDVGYTQKQLLSADYWLIDGAQYDIVEGSLQNNASNIFWEVQLLKSKTGGFNG